MVRIDDPAGSEVVADVDGFVEVGDMLAMGSDGRLRAAWDGETRIGFAMEGTQDGSVGVSGEMFVEEIA